MNYRLTPDLERTCWMANEEKKRLWIPPRERISQGRVWEKADSVANPTFPTRVIDCLVADRVP